MSGKNALGNCRQDTDSLDWVFMLEYQLFWPWFPLRGCSLSKGIGAGERDILMESLFMTMTFLGHVHTTARSCHILQLTETTENDSWCIDPDTLSNCSLCPPICILFFILCYPFCSILVKFFTDKNRICDIYTGCNRKNGPNFGRVFLMLNYTEKTQNTYVQSWTVWEIMAIENCGPRTIAVS